MRYISPPDFHREAAERIGILLVNSGTPALAGARRRARFLAGLPRRSACGRAAARAVAADPVRVHPAFSAAALGAQIPQDLVRVLAAPLLDLSERLRTELIGTLAQRMLAPLSIELGMLYGGEPDGHAGAGAAAGVRRAAHSRRCRCSRSTAAPPPGAAYDQVNGELRRWRWLPGAALRGRLSRSSGLHRRAARKRHSALGAARPHRSTC